MELACIFAMQWLFSTVGEAKRNGCFCALPSRPRCLHLPYRQQQPEVFKAIAAWEAHMTSVESTQQQRSMVISLIS